MSAELSPYEFSKVTHGDCAVVHGLLRDRVLPIVTAEPGSDGERARGGFLRALGCLASLEKLSHPSDFQAVCGSARSLFEMAVDLALLHHDRVRYPMAKLVAWERSAKLAACDRAETRFKGRPPPPGLEQKLEFLALNKDIVEADRQRLWPTKDKKRSRHPPRWTGRALDVDAAEADKLGPYAFRDYYDSRHSELCWNTHGSGLAGVSGVPSDMFPAIISAAHRESSYFALQIAELVLRYIGIDPVPLLTELQETRASFGSLSLAIAKASHS